MPTTLELVILAQDKASGVMSKVSGATADLHEKISGVAVKGLASMNTGFEKTADVMKTVVAGAAAASVGIAAIGLKTALTYEAQISSIKALTGATQNQVDQVNALAFKLGKETKYSALEAAQGIEELLKAGVSLEKVMGGAAAGALDLAAAGELSVAEAAAVASTALNSFKKDGLSVANAADILAGAANASATDVKELSYGLSQASAVASGVGLSFKDTATALAVMAQNGLKGSDAGTSLKTMLTSLTPKTATQAGAFEKLGLMTYDSAKAYNYLVKKGITPASKEFGTVMDALEKYTASTVKSKVGTKTATKAFYDLSQSLGVSHSAFYDMNGDLKALPEIADELQNALKNLSNEQRQVALYTLFGSDAIRIGNILYKEGAEGVKKMAQEMTKFTAADVAKEKMNNLKGAIDNLQSTLETVSLDVFLRAIPLITPYVKDLTDKINAINIDQFFDDLSIIPALFEKIANGGKIFEDDIPVFFYDLAEKIGGTRESMQLVLPFFGALRDKIQEMKEGIQPAIDKFNELNQNGELTSAGLKAFAVVAGVLVVGAIGTMVTPVIAAAAPFVALSLASGAVFYLWETNQPLLLAIAFGITAIAMAITISQIPAMTAGAIAGWAFIAPIIAATAPLLALGLGVAALSYLIITNWELIKSTTIAVWNAIWGFLQPFFFGLGKMIVGVFEGVIKFLSGFGQVIVGIFTGDKAKIEAGALVMLGGITTIFKSVFNGISSFVKGAIDGISSMAKTAIEWVDKALGKKRELSAAEKYDAQFSTKTDGNTVTKIPGYATGTDFFQGGMAQVNERGGEIMNLPRGTQIIPHDISKEMARNSSNSSGTVVNMGGITLQVGAMMGTEKNNREIVSILRDALLIELQKAGIKSDVTV